MRILVIKLGALGDVVIAAAAIQQLAARHGESAVEVLTAPPYATLLSQLCGVRVMTVKRRGFGPLLSAVRMIRRGRYDRVYDLQGSKRSRILTRLSGADERVGLWPGWPYSIAPDTERANKLHAYDRINLCLVAAGEAKAPPSIDLSRNPALSGPVADWIGSHAPADAPLALFHAGCSTKWASKRWPEDSFLRLARTVEAAGFTVVWVGGPEDAQINARLAAQVGIDATGAFALPSLPALGTRARFAVVNDSGPMHLLGASGLPVYALFGPTDPRRSHALGQANRSLSAQVDCSPCFKPQCPLPDDVHRCMKRITPEAVLQRLTDDGLISLR